MLVSRDTVANKLADYLGHRIALSDLVDWAEEVMREGDFDDHHYDTLREVVSRLGVADVRAFGLTWEECEEYLRKLGYRAQVEVLAAR